MWTVLSFTGNTVSSAASFGQIYDYPPRILGNWPSFKSLWFCDAISLWLRNAYAFWILYYSGRSRYVSIPGTEVVHTPCNSQCDGRVFVRDFLSAESYFVGLPFGRSMQTKVTFNPLLLSFSHDNSYVATYDRDTSSSNLVLVFERFDRTSLCIHNAILVDICLLKPNPDISHKKHVPTFK